MIVGYERVKNFENLYEREGAYHHEAYGFRSWFLRDNYEAIAKECSRSEVVLDLACGEGCLGPYLRVKWLAGVDYSQKALDLNRRLHPGVYDELHWGDMRRLKELKLSHRFFDTVVCSLSLMYLIQKDLIRCLRELHERLALGGSFVFTYPTLSPNRAGNPEACELHPEELARELIRAGLEIQRQVPICPWISQEDVKRSESEETRWQTFETYQRAKRRMTLQTSYHFLCRAVKQEE